MVFSSCAEIYTLAQGIMLVVFAIIGSLLGLYLEEKCATSVLWDFRGRGNINTITINNLKSTKINVLQVVLQVLKFRLDSQRF